MTDETIIDSSKENKLSLDEELKLNSIRECIIEVDGIKSYIKNM